MSTQALKILMPLVIGFAVLFAWHVLVLAYDVPRYIVPGPFDVGQTLVQDWELLWNSLLITLRVTVFALLASVIVGTLIAFLFVQSRWVEMSL
ncbi:MAG: ABC transporter permease, partial [Burkholderiales bacterium]